MPRVSIKDSSTNIDVNSGEILYDSLYDRGVELPHGCLAGSCGACRVHIIQGAEHLAPVGVIEANTIAALQEEFRTTKGEEFVQKTEIRLSCRAKVLGDVIICPIK